MSNFTLENLALLLSEAISRKTGADSQQVQMDVLAAMVEERWNPNEKTLPSYIKSIDNYIAYVSNQEPYVYNPATAVEQHSQHLRVGAVVR